MIKKRLLEIVPESKRAIFIVVLFKFIQLCMNILFIYTLSAFISGLFKQYYSGMQLAIAFIFTIIIRDICIKQITKYSFEASKNIKIKLREMIFHKLSRLGTNYQDQVATSKVVQMSVEGVDQLETYFGQYLPQFFYAMAAPFILFIVVCRIDFISALVLLLCVPLIPIVIIIVQSIAKRILAKYWGAYTELGDSFLENLQGLNTLKIYQADEFKTREMEKESEHFRKVTMKVLMMQLNSTAIMDLVTYGGSALGILLAVSRFHTGHITLQGMLMIILLSSEFFIPMRQLGSYFHVAMNGMAASDNIFELLDLEEPAFGIEKIDQLDIKIKDVSFSYDESREVLHQVNVNIPKNSFIGLVGESGSGKSTIASLLTGKHLNYSGDIYIGSHELKEIDPVNLLENITYISHRSLLFQGSVRDNLTMGKEIEDELLNDVLKKTNLFDFFNTLEGLDTKILEGGSNLSGGQRQRLALARALLKDSPIYIFDEATSNIDVESEEKILEIVHELSNSKSIIMISHRLMNTKDASYIYVLNQGSIVEEGKHSELLEMNGNYAMLWNTQQELENLVKEESNHD